MWILNQMVESRLGRGADPCTVHFQKRVSGALTIFPAFGKSCTQLLNLNTLHQHRFGRQLFLSKLHNMPEPAEAGPSSRKTTDAELIWW